MVMIIKSRRTAAIESRRGNNRPARGSVLVLRSLALMLFLTVLANGWIANVYAAAGTASSSPSATASPALTPAQAQLRTLVSAGSLPDLKWPDFANIRDQVQAFYDGGGDAVAWSEAGKPTPQALAMIAQFKQASARGLDPDDYDASRWDARIAKVQTSSPSPSSDDLDRFDVAMTVCAMRLITDLHVGRINPHSLKIEYDVDAKKYDLAAVLRNQVLPADNLDPVMQSIEPQFQGYQRAEVALGNYLKLAAAGDTKPLPVPDHSVHPGTAYPPNPDLIARLKQLGDMPDDADVSQVGAVYKEPIVSAVKHFQTRLGIEPDGILGKGTIVELNRPLSYRVEQLQLTLERYRWIPSTFPEPPIVVNIPEFMLRTMRRQPAPFLTMRVIVGKSYHKQTPVFADYMKYVIFHPYWNVPPSIIHGELIGKISRNPDYVAANDFEVVNSDGQIVTDGTVSNDVLEGLRSGDYSMRQKPGDKNALGQIKFVFPNSYDVYLHGTEAPSLFAHARRDFSHGCIRVENPPALAAWVLRDQPGWDANHIKEVLDSGKTVQVNLDKPIPVLILYSTAVVNPDGEVRFFDDIYDYDARLKAILAVGYPARG
jgi:L,D-transpeptidase YcbB